MEQTENIYKKELAVVIDTKNIGIGVVISLTIGTILGYMDIRDRLTRMEAQLEILAPVAIDHMVAIELEKKTGVPHGVAPTIAVTPNQPVISEDTMKKIRNEKRREYQQSAK